MPIYGTVESFKGNGTGTVIDVYWAGSNAQREGDLGFINSNNSVHLR